MQSDRQPRRPTESTRPSPIKKHALLRGRRPPSKSFVMPQQPTIDFARASLPNITLVQPVPSVQPVELEQIVPSTPIADSKEKVILPEENAKTPAPLIESTEKVIVSKEISSTKAATVSPPPLIRSTQVKSIVVDVTSPPKKKSSWFCGPCGSVGDD